jgi:hypothetical protein
VAIFFDTRKEQDFANPPAFCAKEGFAKKFAFYRGKRYGFSSSWSAVADLIPMKRELKALRWASTCSISHVADLIPMKRELKEPSLEPRGRALRELQTSSQ